MLDTLWDNKEWVFSGIGVAVLTFVMTVLWRHRTAARSGENPVRTATTEFRVGPGSTVSGNLAGRDLYIFESTIEPRLNELISVLERRAELVASKFCAEYQTVSNAAEYLRRFKSLHRDHIAALRRRDLLLAHEILVAIHKLSYDVEMENLGGRRSPTSDYAMLGNAGRRGPVVCLYLRGEFARNSPCYPFPAPMDSYYPRTSRRHASPTAAAEYVDTLKKVL